MEPPSTRSLIYTAAARRAPLVGVVGPCGSGKSTLIAGLEKHGYRCRHIAQEHSYVQAMWQKIAKPDILIYLDASFLISTRRRQLNWQKKDHDEQIHRLTHARHHANLCVVTDNLTPDQVLRKVLDYLEEIER
jgi:ABC-type cobalamin/Fe3+-siderophores transport system ATPase subunit